MNSPTLNPRPSFWTTVGIVAKREIVARFLSKSFIISTAITLVFIVGFMVLGPRIGDMFGGSSEDQTIAVTPAAAQVVGEIPGYTTEEVADDAAARAAVESEEADAAVVASDGRLGITVIGLHEPPSALVSVLTVSPDVDVLQPQEDSNEGMKFILALGFGLLWMMSAVTFGMSIANSVVEEKQTRIVEILLASVSARALLTGKIIGNSAAALVQILLTVGAVFLGAAINGDAFPIADLTAPIAWFVALFLIGFVMIAAMYAAAAALVSRSEDLANVQQPIMWLIMIPYFAIIFFGDNPLALTIMSYIPFTAPVAVPMRVFTGDTAWWEPLVSLGLLAATTAVIIVLAAKIYSNGLLRTGKPLKWREALQAGD